MEENKSVVKYTTQFQKILKGIDYENIFTEKIKV